MTTRPNATIGNVPTVAVDYLIRNLPPAADVHIGRPGPDHPEGGHLFHIEVARADVGELADFLDLAASALRSVEVPF